MKSKELLYTFVKTPSRETRHLLFHSINGASETCVSVMQNGNEDLIAKGTEHETRKRADEVASDWKKEGFKRVESRDALDSLGNTLALAKACGHKIIYDPRIKNSVLGSASLDLWEGVRQSNGSDYEYGFDDFKIYARAKVPAAFNMTPASNAEVLEVFRKVAEFRRVEKDYEFLLGGKSDL